MKIILGSDHAGYAVKNKIKAMLQNQGYTIVDAGPARLNPHDDYPQYAAKVSRIIARSRGVKGILVCGTGTGMVIAANKIKGIRAVAAYDLATAKQSRTDNDANVLALRGKGFSWTTMRGIIQTWLRTPFSKKPRYMRRIRELMALERT